MTYENLLGFLKLEKRCKESPLNRNCNSHGSRSGLQLEVGCTEKCSLRVCLKGHSTEGRILGSLCKDDGNGNENAAKQSF